MPATPPTLRLTAELAFGARLRAPRGVTFGGEGR